MADKNNAGGFLGVPASEITQLNDEMRAQTRANEISTMPEQNQALVQELVAGGMPEQTAMDQASTINLPPAAANFIGNQPAPQQVPVQPDLVQQAEQAGSAQADVVLAADAEQKAFNRKLAMKENEIDRRIQAIKDDVQKVDPDRFWNNKSTGQKISIGIGLMLGGIGSGLTGGPNTAAQMINSAIDNDIQAQKLDIDSAMAKKSMALELVKMDLQRMAANRPDPVAQLQAAKLNAEIDKIKAETDAKQREMIGGKPLSGGDQSKLDYATNVLIGLQNMREALNAGDRTFTLVGDNPFTYHRRIAAEFFGRLQSGGVISKEEEANFISMLPVVSDSAEMRELKLRTLEDDMRRRIRGLGRDPESIVQEGYKPTANDVDYGKVETLMRAFPKMTKEEALKEVLKRKLGK